MNPLPDHRLDSDASPKPDYSQLTIAELEAAYGEQKPSQQQEVADIEQPQAHGPAQFLAKCRSTIGNHPKLIYGSALAGVSAMLLLTISILFVPQSIAVSFSRTQNCVVSPTLFPSMFKSSSDSFKLDRPASISIGRVALFANTLCATPTATPLANKQYATHQVFSLSKLHMSKSVSITTGSYLKIKAASFNKDSKVPLLKPLEFKLDDSDQTFSYEVVANKQNATCSKNQQTLTCDLQDLKLAYGSQYQLALVRRFQEQAPNTVTATTVKTITATAITKTSIKSGAMVYDKPQQITLETNKTLTKVEEVSLTATNNGKATTIPTTSSFKDATITITIPDALPRNTHLTAHIKNVTANDDSQLEQAYDLPFSTSGGPKATKSNLASSGVGFRPVIIVSFDQKLLSSQDPAKLVSLTANKQAHPATYSISDNKLIIRPQANFPVCARVGIQVNNSAQSQYGISGNSARLFNARVQCYTTYSIGTSVSGRAITAYQFGSGKSMVLYVGAMHGNEQNSMRLLQKWIAELNARPDSIPAGRSIVVIPASNPDGVIANTRQNAHKIDLNRNFPTNNWQTKVTVPGGGGKLTNQGGPFSLSEPESQALASFVQAKRPRLMLTYHSHAGIVESNEAGDSEAIGNVYGSKSGYKAVPTRAIGKTFDYSTTGAFEDWMKDRLGLPALCVELRSSTADEFYLNRNAMWAMAKL